MFRYRRVPIDAMVARGRVGTRAFVPRDTDVAAGGVGSGEEENS